MNLSEPGYGIRGCARSRDARGGTFLHTIAARGSVVYVEEDIVLARLLLAAGADPSAVNGAGWTPIIYAAAAGYIVMVRLLVSHDRRTANDATALRHTTALHIAALRGDAAMVRELVQAGADVTATDVTWNTPLFYAGKARHDEIVGLLHRCVLHKASSARSRELSAPTGAERADGGSGAAASSPMPPLRVRTAARDRPSRRRPLTAAVLLRADSAGWSASAGAMREHTAGAAAGTTRAAATQAHTTTSFAAAHAVGALDDAAARLAQHVTRRL